MRSSLPIHRIAEQAGVSPATVSRVIHHRELVRPGTAQAIFAAMEALGLDLPEDAVVSASSKPVLFINTVRDANPFYMEVFRGIETAAAAHGYDVLRTSSPLLPADLPDYLALIKRVGVSGLLTLSQLGLEELNRLSATVPVIQCCEYNEDSDVPYVSIDDNAAARQAVEFLIAAGRNKIAFLNGPEKFRYARQRRAGFMEAMHRSGLTVPRDWILQIPEIDYEMAFSSVSQILSSEIRPNAVFAVSDVLAQATVNAARRNLLKVPADLMVIGFDDIPLCKMVRPTITTIAQPQFQLGYTACENLITQIERPGYVESVTLGTELIIRGTARNL